MADLIMCEFCGGTGEGFRQGMQGDGWTGLPCKVCEGEGTLLEIDGKTFPFAGSGVYRDATGRFASVRKALGSSWWPKPEGIEGLPVERDLRGIPVVY